MTTRKDLSSFFRELNEVGKEHYNKNLTLENHVKLPDPYSLTTDWCNDPSKLPDVSFADIYMYLIHTPSEFTHEKLKAHKSLEAYNFFICGHVQNVGLREVKNRRYYFLRSSVLPSQRQGQKEALYEVWIALHEKGWILTGNCTCPSGYVIASLWYIIK